MINALPAEGGMHKLCHMGREFWGALLGVRWMGGGKVTELGSALPLSPGLHQKKPPLPFLQTRIYGSISADRTRHENDVIFFLSMGTVFGNLEV